MILMTREWEILFPGVHGYKRPRDFSEHNALIFATQYSDQKLRREFRFELTWIRHPEFLERVKEIWEHPTRDSRMLDHVQFKIKKVKKFLKGWDFNLTVDRKKRKQEIGEQISILKSWKRRPFRPESGQEGSGA
jgi:hypothetical protein